MIKKKVRYNMKPEKFNSNYNHNTRYNLKKIKKIVDGMMKEKVNPQTLDFLFRYNTRNYPKTSHDELELPGKFNEIKDSAVFIINDTAKQMDYLETIKPDNKMVQREAANNVEQQTGILNDPKIKDIFDYCLYTTIQLKKPCYAIVVTDYDYEKEYEDYVVEGFSFRIYFRIYNKNRIYKLLNMLKRKDYSKVELSNRDYIRFIYCLIFAKKEFAKEIIEELTYLFATIEKIKFVHQLDLHLALKMMIKFRFKDDLTRKEELLTMITKSVHESKHDEVTGYEVKQKSVEELKNELNIKERIISQKDNIITEQDNIITEKDNRIKKLEAILSSNQLL